MFGQYKRITNQFTGVLTGKGLEYGGSLIRTEATGYGAVYFLQSMLERRGDTIEGKRAVISGSGNVATHAAEKVVQLGGMVLTLSDSEGFVHDPAGIDAEKLAWVKERRTCGVVAFRRYPRSSRRDLQRRRAPWGVPCDLALPCATQNELLGADAKTLLDNGCIGAHLVSGSCSPSKAGGLTDNSCTATAATRKAGSPSDRRHPAHSRTGYGRIPAGMCHTRNVVRVYRPLSAWSAIATIAAFVWELSLGIRLLPKVFKPSTSPRDWPSTPPPAAMSHSHKVAEMPG